MTKEDKKIDFESSLKELEKIVAKLEDDDINLEDSVKSYCIWRGRCCVGWRCTPNTCI